MTPARITGLLCILLFGLIFIAVSYRPEMRFADPTPEASPERIRNFDCYYHRIYSGDGSVDILLTGASRTFWAVDEALVSAALHRGSGEQLNAHAFGTAWSGPDVAYFYFRDYLEHNPAPQVALFELTVPKRGHQAPRYIHPLAPDFAPLYLYPDILHSWGFVKSRIFAVSDLLRVFIRHIDLSFAKLLVADYQYRVPGGGACPEPELAKAAMTLAAVEGDSYAQMLAASMAALRPDLPAAQIGTYEAVAPLFEADTFLGGRLKEAERRRTEKKHAWRTDSTREFSIQYYRRITELARQHGTKIGFYILPNLLADKGGDNDLEELAAELGAPVFMLPYEYQRISYHHYKDMTHVKSDMLAPYAIWFADLIDRLRER